MEQQLKSRHPILSQNGIEQHSSDSDTDNNDLDELNGYNGFGGDMELDRSTNVDYTIPLELVAVTNQTSV